MSRWVQHEGLVKVIKTNYSHFIALQYQYPFLIKFDPLSEPEYFPLAETQSSVRVLTLYLNSEINLSLFDCRATLLSLE